MSWNYSGDPSKSNKDAVRFHLGDTDNNHEQVNDEEIEYSLDQNSASISSTVLSLAIALRNKYAPYVNEKTDRVSIEYGKMYEHFKDLVIRLKKDSVVAAVPYAGGISIADKTACQEDTDRVKPEFTKDMDEHRDGTAETYGDILGG